MRAIFLLAWLAMPGVAAAQITYIDEPLTGSPTGGVAPGITAGSAGGSFGPEGWTTTGDTDTVWWVIPAAIVRGRFEISARGLAIETSLRGQEHDLFGLYGPTDRAEPVPYNPWYRNNEFKILVRIFGDLNRCAGCQAVGASKLELALCPALTAEGYIETMCPAACVAAGYDFWQAYLGPRGRDEALPWDAATEYRFVVTWEPGMMTYTRSGPEGSASLGYPGTYAPRELRVRIGPPSSERGPDTAMPRGVTFRNVLVTGEVGATTPSCDGPGPMPDAGPPPGCGGGAPISAVALDPSSGSGAAQVFRATYRHCDGAAAFRIAQLWVGDSVEVAVPHIGLGYEGGRFFMDGTTDTCAPGERIGLAGTHGTLDCARSTATPAGTDLVVEWALTFNTSTFGGAHNVYFDAKGGAGDPEPRLGWTMMGTYTVTSAPAGTDAGPGTGRDAGTGRPLPRPSVDDGCGCTTPGSRRAAPPLALLLASFILLFAVGRDHRRRSPRRNGDTGGGLVITMIAVIAAIATLAACGSETPAEGPAAPAPAAGPASARTPPPSAAHADDALLTAVCNAYDEISTERVAPDLVLSSTALRAVERHGVTEAQLATLGATRETLLASILRRGNPPGCAPFVAYLRGP